MSDHRWQPPEPDPFVALSDDERVRAAVQARAAGRERRERAAEVATWEGSLRDLAEREVAVVVAVPGDRTHRGSLLAVGVDHLAIALASGTVVLVTLDTVRSVRPEAGSAMPVATGDRERSQDRTLAEALDYAREGGDEIVITVRDRTDPLSGTLIAVGEDVLTIRVARGPAGIVYLPLAAVAEVVVAAAPA